jgi:hypothetical protein
MRLTRSRKQHSVCCLFVDLLSAAVVVKRDDTVFFLKKTTCRFSECTYEGVDQTKNEPISIHSAAVVLKKHNGTNTRAMRSFESNTFGGQL